MRKVYGALMLMMLFCIGCEWHFKNSDGSSDEGLMVERYDRIESLYLTTGDFSALQQMNTGYPQQTRTLIEDVLKIGRVNEPEINVKFLNFFQDTTLQSLITAVQQEYAKMDDINKDLNSAFEHLQKLLPDMEMPQVYAQIGSLDQSIIVGNGLIGISLDKYLGKNYPLYLRQEYGYTEQQREVMTRQFIVPDCVGFYLLSLYPPSANRQVTQMERDVHVGKVQWVVNKVMKREVFNTLYTRSVGHYMDTHPDVSIDQLMKNDNYKAIR